MYEEKTCVCDETANAIEPKLIEKIQIIKDIQVRNCSIALDIGSVLFALPDIPKKENNVKCLNDDINELMDICRVQTEILLQIKERI